MAFASEFGLDVEVVGAVEVDVVVLRRGQVCGLVGDREAFAAQGVEGVREIGRCPARPAGRTGGDVGRLPAQRATGALAVALAFIAPSFVLVVAVGAERTCRTTAAIASPELPDIAQTLPARTERS